MWRGPTYSIDTDLSAPRVSISEQDGSGHKPIRTYLMTAAFFGDGTSGPTSYLSFSQELARTHYHNNLRAVQCPQMLKNPTVRAVNRRTCWVTTWSARLARTVRGSLACPSHSFDHRVGKAALQHTLNSHRWTPGKNIDFWRVSVRKEPEPEPELEPPGERGIKYGIDRERGRVEGRNIPNLLTCSMFVDVCPLHHQKSGT
jgi:hypothetical protein